MNYRQKVGKFGEKLAIDYLIKHGYCIIETNVKISYKEIDVVANFKGKMIFVEVKTRQNLEYGEPEYAITKSKQKQIRKIAELYLFDKEIMELECRFDVVAVLLQGKGKPVINHYENAFM